jgi:cobalamin biosynthetic protein CobC
MLHGGSLLAARRLFPGAPEPIIDLSTGINPYPWTMPELSPEVFTRLPEPADVQALEEAAAAAYGAADPALVAAAPGTQILISLLPRLFPLRSVAVASPTYTEHAAAWRAAGARVTELPVPDGTEADGLVLCNPNNPDGRRHAPELLLRRADRLAARGGLLVVDEAFADLEPEPLSLAPFLPHPAVIVLRSFGKTYGLAGLRLGFALAAPDRAAAIRAALGPWAVSGPALAAGPAALRDHAWRDTAAARLQADAARLDRLLTDAGLAVVGGTSLFRLAEGEHAPLLFQRLGRAGILVRRFPERPAWLRFGVPGSAEAWDRLRRALA